MGLRKSRNRRNFKGTQEHKILRFLDFARFWRQKILVNLWFFRFIQRLCLNWKPFCIHTKPERVKWKLTCSKRYANDNFTVKRKKVEECWEFENNPGVLKRCAALLRFSIEKLREQQQNYPYQIDSRLISREKKTRKTAKNIQITAWKDFIEATPTQTRPDMKCQSNRRPVEFHGKTNWR